MISLFGGKSRHGVALPFLMVFFLPNTHPEWIPAIMVKSYHGPMLISDT